MNLTTLERTSGEDPDASVIWLHGLGADGSDFYDIVPMLELPKTLAVRFIFPNAPEMPVTVNGGYVMPAWYDLSGIGNQYPDDLQGIQRSRDQLLLLVEKEKQKGINPERIILAGFSQGGVIALHTGLRCAQKLGGILALSTYLALPESLQAEKRAPEDLEILMMHGRDDNVVPIELAKSSCKTITESGYKVTWKEYAMPHSVCPEQMKCIGSWLSERLGIS